MAYFLDLKFDAAVSQSWEGIRARLLEAGGVEELPAAGGMTGKDSVSIAMPGIPYPAIDIFKKLGSDGNTPVSVRFSSGVPVDAFREIVEQLLACGERVGFSLSHGRETLLSRENLQELIDGAEGWLSPTKRTTEHGTAQ